MENISFANKTGVPHDKYFTVSKDKDIRISVNVTDPFGAYDIRDVSVNVTAPNGTSVYNNSMQMIAGFNRTGLTGNILRGPGDPIFAGWDMLSAIGPIVGTGDFSLIISDVITTGGVLLFTTTLTSPVTFSATVPEPFTALLLAPGLAALALRRRRAR